MKLIQNFYNAICGRRCKNSECRTNALAYEVRAITEEVQKMSVAVDNLVIEVAALKTVSLSASALLTRLFTLLQGAIDTGDMVKVQAALDDIKTQKDELAAAITQNTPVEPPGPPA